MRAMVTLMVLAIGYLSLSSQSFVIAGNSDTETQNGHFDDILHEQNTTRLNDALFRLYQNTFLLEKGKPSELSPLISRLVQLIKSDSEPPRYKYSTFLLYKLSSVSGDHAKTVCDSGIGEKLVKQLDSTDTHVQFYSRKILINFSEHIATIDACMAKQKLSDLIIQHAYHKKDPSLLFDICDMFIAQFESGYFSVSRPIEVPGSLVQLLYHLLDHIPMKKYVSNKFLKTMDTMIERLEPSIFKGIYQQTMADKLLSYSDKYPDESFKALKKLVDRTNDREFIKTKFLPKLKKLVFTPDSYKIMAEILEGGCEFFYSPKFADQWLIEAITSTINFPASRQKLEGRSSIMRDGERIYLNEIRDAVRVLSQIIKCSTETDIESLSQDMSLLSALEKLGAFEDDQHAAEIKSILNTLKRQRLEATKREIESGPKSSMSARYFSPRH